MKNKNILMMGMVAVSLLVSGCSEKKGSVEYYKKHKDEMQAKIKSCTKRVKGYGIKYEYNESEECKNALKANNGINKYNDDEGELPFGPGGI